MSRNENMKYLISVIIPTYNAEKFIKSSVKSVINQTLGFENIELILVDDNSSDSTRDILNDLSERYENIRAVLLNDNSGTAGRGRNIGIENAQSEYIMFLDQDDLYLDDICEVLFNTISKTKTDIVMCNHKIIRDRVPSDLSSYKQDLDYLISNPLENKNIFYDCYMWNKIFKREFLKKNEIRCTEGYLLEDLYFILKSYMHTDKVAYLKNYTGYLYSERDSEENSSLSNTISEKNYLNYIEGFYKIIDLLKEYGQNIINEFMKEGYLILIGLFSRLNTDVNTKRDLFDRLYEFYQYAGFSGKLNELWADIIFSQLKNRNFKRFVFIASIVNLLFNFRKLRLVYRIIYKRKIAE